MNNNQDFMIYRHLENLIDELERKLAFPKNDWRRREQLQAEIADAQKRLAVVSGRNRKSGTTREPGLSSRTAQRRTNPRREDTSTKPARPLPRLLEVNYR